MATGTITRELIECAIDEGVLYVGDSRFYGDGVVACVCSSFGSAADNEFFFAGPEYDGWSACDYLRDRGIDGFAEDVLDVLESDFQTEFPDEYGYYLALFDECAAAQFERARSERDGMPET